MTIPILTYADYVAQAGLVEAPLMTPPPYQWTQRAYISFGNRLHGDNVNSNWKALFSGAPYYSELRSMAWSDIVGWILVQPGAANTCTNSAVQIYDFQMQIFNLDTQRWELISSPAYYRDMTTSVWYDLPTQHISYGAPDLIYPPGKRYNLPALSTVINPSDRLGSTSDTTKFALFHNATTRSFNIDYTKIGGIAALCRAKLVSVDGNAFNGTNQMMLCVGIDSYPTPYSIAEKGTYTTLGGNIGAGDTTIPVVNGALMPAYSTVKLGGTETISYTSVSGNNLLGCTRGVNGTTATSHASGENVEGLLTNISLISAIAISAFRTVGVDEKPFMATTAKLTNDVLVQNTSDWQIAHGPNSQCMSAALFAENVPQFMIY